jgi:hypothetical protein
MKGLLSRRAGTLCVTSLAAVSIALCLATTAGAVSHHKNGEYAQFAECPLKAARVSDCVYSRTSGGSLVIGRKAVPIEDPVVLQGGFEGAGSSVKFYGAAGGHTLSSTPQAIPDALDGVVAPAWWPPALQEWFAEEAGSGASGVNATIQLAGPTTGYLPGVRLNTENLIFGEGTALTLPVKVHLESAFLGAGCYIGSDARPVRINFTTGPSGKLRGDPGTAQFNSGDTATTVKGGKLVDNTFAVPAAKGCGGIFSVFVDPLVDSIVGTPATSGMNSAALEGDFHDAAASAVSASR